MQVIDKFTAENTNYRQTLRRAQSNDDANRRTKQICRCKSKGYYIHKSTMVKMFEFNSRKNKF